MMGMETLYYFFVILLSQTISKQKYFQKKHWLCSNFFSGFCWLSFYFRIKAKRMSLRLKFTVSLSSCNLVYNFLILKNLLYSKWIPWVGHTLPLICVFSPVPPSTWSALLPALFYEIFTKLSNRSHKLIVKSLKGKEIRSCSPIFRLLACMWGWFIISCIAVLCEVSTQ